MIKTVLNDDGKHEEIDQCLVLKCVCVSDSCFQQ